MLRIEINLEKRSNIVYSYAIKKFKKSGYLCVFCICFQKKEIVTQKVIKTPLKIDVVNPFLDKM